MTEHYFQPYITQGFPVFDPSAALYYRGNGGAAAMESQHQLALQYGLQAHHQESIHHLRELQQTALYHQRQAGVMLGNNAQQMISVLPPFAALDCPTTGSQLNSNRIQTNAQRRAVHNASERLRREILNNQFQQLANTLPNLENDRRPSKGTIIERTLDFVKITAAKEEEMICEIANLRAEQDALRRQLEQDFSPTLDSDDSSDGSFSPIDNHHRPLSAADSCPSLELPSATLDFYSAGPEESMFSTDDAAAMYSSLEETVNPFGIPPRMSYESDDDNYSSSTPDEMDFAAVSMAMTAPDIYPSTTQSIFGFPLYHQ